MRRSSRPTASSAITPSNTPYACSAGRPPDDPAVRTFGGALFGVALEVMFRWVREPDMDLATEVDLVAELDEALARLGAGLPFE